MRLTDYVPDRSGTQDELTQFLYQIQQQGRPRFHIPERSLPSSTLERTLASFDIYNGSVQSAHLDVGDFSFDIYVSNDCDAINTQRDKRFASRETDVCMSATVAGEVQYGVAFGAIDVFSRKGSVRLRDVGLMRDALAALRTHVGFGDDTRLEIAISNMSPKQLKGVYHQLQRTFDAVLMYTNEKNTGRIIDVKTEEPVNFS